MTIKETIKSLIAIKQQEIPVPYNPREVELPLNAKKIITVVGVRRCGKSTLMELCIERFTKLDEFKQGAGLGLSICRTVADRLDGNVWLDTSYTGGARFFLTIPCITVLQG